jgi:hypothetical protein
VQGKEILNETGTYVIFHVKEISSSEETGEGTKDAEDFPSGT